MAAHPPPAGLKLRTLTNTEPTTKDTGAITKLIRSDITNAPWKRLAMEEIHPEPDEWQTIVPSPCSYRMAQP